ncbi:MAG TPA: DUF4350 domain-containing protein, partial [Chitinophagaceae bacterium]
SKDDKNPFGSYILYDRLHDLFPSASLLSLREPAYNLLHDRDIRNAAYVVVAPSFRAGEADISELLKFVEMGNYVFVSAGRVSDKLLDTLGIEKDDFVPFLTSDSTSYNFTNPALRSEQDYIARRSVAGQYFRSLNKKDSTIILGVSRGNNPNFIKVEVGSGAFLVHAAPLVFSNYSMLSDKNYEYVAKAFSYLPVAVNTVYWDEYYKQGRTGPQTPLRFILSNEWLRWALRLSIVAMVVFALVEMKRRQRIIPVIEPLRNTTVDFVKTVSAVYLSQHDNRGIAHNLLQYWMQHVRQRYYIQTNELNEEFIQALHRKSGVDENIIRELAGLVYDIPREYEVTDTMLLELNRRLDEFYTLSKT